VIELPIVSKEKRTPKPSWLKIDLPTGENYTRVKRIVKEHKLHTICEDGRCPNMGECWGEGTATFMILFVRAVAVSVLWQRVDLVNMT
jgi:lipoic acid synthetase